MFNKLVGASTVRADKGNSLLEMPDNYIVIDLETTGLDPAYDKIIEFGAIRVRNNEVISEFSSLVNPGCLIDDFISELTGITNKMLAKAPTIEKMLPKFLDFIGDDIVVGHNVNFDINFLYEAKRTVLDSPFTNDFIDTMRISRRLYPQERHHRLVDLIQRFELGTETSHRALSDVYQTNECYTRLKKILIESGIDLSSYVRKSSYWSAKDIQSTNVQFDETNQLFGKQFVFTGTLERMDRKEAMQIVVDRGGLCGDNVTQKTNYLVLGNFDYCTTIKDGKSIKRKKAEQLKLEGSDIEIISENVFYDMIS